LKRASSYGFPPVRPAADQPKARRSARADENEIARFCFLLFFEIRASQGVTHDSSTFSGLVSSYTQNVSTRFAGLSGSCSFDPAHGKLVAQNSDFRKQKIKFLYPTAGVTAERRSGEP
jgi:hypothetical protein